MLRSRARVSSAEGSAIVLPRGDDFGGFGADALGLLQGRVGLLERGDAGAEAFEESPDFDRANLRELVESDEGFGFSHFWEVGSWRRLGWVLLGGGGFILGELFGERALVAIGEVFEAEVLIDLQERLMLPRKF